MGARDGPQVRSALERYAAGVNAAAGASRSAGSGQSRFSCSASPPRRGRRLIRLPSGGCWRGVWPRITSPNWSAAHWRQKFGDEAARQLSGRYPADAPDDPGTRYRPGAIRIGGCHACPSRIRADHRPTPDTEGREPAQNGSPSTWPAGLEWLHPRRSGEQQQLGAWPAPGPGAAARSWPTIRTCSRVPVGVVRDAPGGRRPRCHRRHDSRRAFRGARPQPPDRLGHDQLWRRRAGPRRSNASTSARSVRSGRRVGAGGGDPRGDSRARPQRAAAVRSLEDAGTARCSRSRVSTGRRRRVAVAGRPGRRHRAGRAYALRWDVGGDTASSRSRRSIAPPTGTRSRRRSTRFAAPSQNIVYADVDGNIGYAMSRPAAGAQHR